FFEESLGLYVIGERTESGYRPRRRRIIQSSLPSILEVFRGEQDFIGWNDPTAIIERAEKWLRDGGPYQNTLAGASRLISYLRWMRNAIAHASDSATEKYERATRNLYGAVPKRLTPGSQLLRPPPPAIPYLIGPTLFDASIR